MQIIQSTEYCSNAALLICEYVWIFDYDKNDNIEEIHGMALLDYNQSQWDSRQIEYHKTFQQIKINANQTCFSK